MYACMNESRKLLKRRVRFGAAAAFLAASQRRIPWDAALLLAILVGTLAGKSPRTKKIDVPVMILGF